MYLIRHAEAEGNVYRRAHGHYNGGLTSNGLAQLACLQKYFKGHKIDALYASDLQRTLQTAEAVAEVCHLPVQREPRLREIALGEWEDRPWGALIEEGIDVLGWFEGKSNHIVKEAETRDIVKVRMRKVAEEIAARHVGETIILVSHGCAIRYLLELYAEEFVPHLDNASVSLLEWEGKEARLLFAGENAFLKDLSTHAKQDWWKEGFEARKDVELWFSPASLPEDLDAVMAYSREAWRSVYGTMDGYQEETNSRAFFESAETNPRYLQFVMKGSKRIGLFHMRDAGRLSVSDGHIALFYLDAAHQGCGLGVQLLGEAISLAKLAEKKGLTLRVFHQNRRALAFYKKMGFVQCGEEEGRFGKIHHMRLAL